MAHTSHRGWGEPAGGCISLRARGWALNPYNQAAMPGGNADAMSRSARFGRISGSAGLAVPHIQLMRKKPL